MELIEQLDISHLSAHLFWDVNPDQIDIETDFRFILSRVLQYGMIRDWVLLVRYAGLERIATEAKEIRSLDDRSLHFIASITGSKLEEFKCYTWKQSIPGHGIF